MVTGQDLTSTVRAAAELEETARLLITLRGGPVRMLAAADVAELRDAFT